RLLHFFLHQAPVATALQLLDAKLERPKCLNRDAIDLVTDTLAKGIVVLLTRGTTSQGGAWRIERHVRGEEVVKGRLWERTPPDKLGMSFSRNTLDFLIYITAKKAADDKKGWQPVT